MNIDERMQMLQVNLESLHSNILQLVEAGQISERRIDKVSAVVDKLSMHMTKLMQTMDRLANIVIRHEERLDSLDGGQ